VRACWLLTSYITVVTSPGCTSILFCSGLKPSGPRAFASNSIEIVRLMSTCVFLASRAVASRCTRLLMPVTSQIARYIGTNANPKPNIRSATTASLNSIGRLKERSAPAGGCVDIELPQRITARRYKLVTQGQ